MITMKHGKTNKAGMTKKNTDVWTQIHGTQIHGTQIHGKVGIPKPKGTTHGSMRQPVGTTMQGINNGKPLKQDQEGRCDLMKTKKEKVKVKEQEKEKKVNQPTKRRNPKPMKQKKKRSILRTSRRWPRTNSWGSCANSPKNTDWRTTSKWKMDYLSCTPLDSSFQKHA